MESTDPLPGTASIHRDTETINKLKMAFVLLLNPDESEDQRIIASVRDEEDCEKRRKIAENLIIRISYLLKHDWERAKSEAAFGAFGLRWLGAIRKELFEPERRNLPCGLYDDLKSGSVKCCRGSRPALRTAGRALRSVAATVAAYVALHAMFEARHDRQMNEVLFERDVFVSLVTSGNRGDFVTAMKTFGEIQRREIYSAPPLLKIWRWWDLEEPNRDALWQWARDRLALCKPSECGDPSSAIRHGGFRIDLENADLRNGELRAVNFSGSNLIRAEFNDAVLVLADFQLAHLWNADLSAAELTDAKFQHADLFKADLQEAVLWKADFENASLEEVDFRHADLQHANLRYADLRNADLQNADLRNADLRHAVGIVCDELKQALNWKLAYRDSVSRCGALLPSRTDQARQ